MWVENKRKIPSSIRCERAFSRKPRGEKFRFIDFNVDNNM